MLLKTTFYRLSAAPQTCVLAWWCHWRCLVPRSVHWTIESTTLRGVESNGMLCSAKELGLDTEASGLMELPEDAPIGTPLADYLALPDASIEIKLTPNRADCFSVRGIAFDVAAACASEVTPFHIDEIPAVSARTLPVELHAGANAPRYCGCVIEGIDSAAPTPVWMAERLRRSGIRPVSLLVDITQYVMLELGRPMHASTWIPYAVPIAYVSPVMMKP